MGEKNKNGTALYQKIVRRRRGRVDDGRRGSGTGKQQRLSVVVADRDAQDGPATKTSVAVVHN